MKFFSKVMDMNLKKYVLLLFVIFPVAVFGGEPVCGSCFDSNDLLEKRAAALKGDNEARVWVAMATEDPKERVHWLLMAAKEGYPDAQSFLASLYDIQDDFRKGFVWWKKLAAQGDLDAAVTVANAYQSGRGVSRNIKKEYVWRFLIQGFDQNNCRRLREIESSILLEDKNWAHQVADSISKGFSLSVKKSACQPPLRDNSSLERQGSGVG